MGKKCCVPNCTSGYATSNDKRTQFSFPREEDLKTKWIAAIRRKDFVVSSKTTIEDIFATESTASLCRDLSSGYDYVFTRNLQSDPLERYFFR